jgi:large subunit ribosomal protein L10
MNRDQKAVAIAEIVAQIDESQAIFAVDYRGISVPQAAELRSTLRESDATFKVVKNSLTELAADQAGAETLKAFLAGPTALTFVRGDVATAAKAIADYGRATQLLPFKGGLMEGAPLDVEQIRSLSRLPSRQVLYGQLVGVVASPVSGLVRTLGALLGGLATALGQVQGKKESGEIPAGPPPAAEAPAVAAEPLAEAEGTSTTAEPAPEEPQAKGSSADESQAEESKAEEPQAEESQAEASQAEEPAAEEPKAEEPQAEEPAAEEPKAEEPKAEEPQAEEPAAEEPKAEEPRPDAEAAAENQAEPAHEPAQDDDNPADASAATQSDDADANPTKED